jgi:hypothetical protein
MKIIILYSLTVFFVLIANILPAQTDPLLAADSVLNAKGEVYFKFKMEDRTRIDTLSRVISIDYVKDGNVFAYANRNEFTRFLEFRLDYTVLPHPGSLLTNKELNMGNWQKDSKNMTIWNFYPTYSQYVGFMNTWASTYPSICKLDTIGTTIQGRLILTVKISDSVNYDRGVPQFFFTSSIHGDETTGYIMMMHLIDSLLNAYGTSPRITDLVNKIQIYINPLSNPDGTYRGGDNTVSGAVRGNANNIDMNRNYADPQDGQHPDGYPWQPETMAFMNYADKHRFSMAMNFHGGAEVVNYPWDTWAQLAADDSWWQFVSNEYADTAQTYGLAGYFTNPYPSGITNGYAWYTISGGRQDYHNYFEHAREVTLEISNTKNPAAGQLLNYWKYNYRSLLNYLSQCAYGIKGKVYDSVTYAPIAAKVLIATHDIDSSFVYSHLPSGWYFRLIDNGSWNITFSAPGYYSRTLSSVSSARYGVNLQYVKLRPLDIYFPRSFAATAVSPYQINLSWTKNGLNDPVMIAYNTISTFGTPVNGTAYTPGMSISGGGTVIYNGSSTAYSHVGLSPNTTYYYKAWSVSSGNNYSAPAAANATTSCGVYSGFPITENFTTATIQPPNCWTQEASGTNAIHKWVRSNSSQAGGTAWEMRMTSQNVNPGTTRLKTYFFNTVGVTMLTLSFKHRMTGIETGATLRIQSSSDGINWTNESWSQASLNGSVGPATVSLNISNNLNSPSTMIAFMVTGNLNMVTNWYIDDVSIKAPGYWVGGTLASPTDWNTGTNWGDGLVPGASTNAYIPARTYLPVVFNDPGSPAQCNDLVIEKNAGVTVNPGKSLNVNGNLIMKAP